MNCVICKQGQIQPGLVTVTLDREGAIVVFKRVPAEVCENCGEYYLSDEVTGELLARAEEATRVVPRLKFVVMRLDDFCHRQATSSLLGWFYYGWNCWQQASANKSSW